MRKLLIILFSLFVLISQAQTDYYKDKLLISNSKLMTANSKLVKVTDHYWIDSGYYNSAIPEINYMANLDTFRVFNDQLSFYPISYNNEVLNIDYNCDIGTTDSLGFYILPNDTLLGYFDLEMIVKKNNKRLDTINTKIFYTPDSATNTDTVRILLLGNSVTSQSAQVIAAILLDSPNKIVKTYGKLGNEPYKNEGDSGKTYNWFVNSLSPLWYSGALNVTSYRADVGATEPFDIVFIMLGINDLIPPGRDTSYTSGMITDAKTLIDAFLTDTAKNIIVVSNTSSENRGDGWTLDYCTQNPEYGFCDYQDYFDYKTQYFRTKLLSNFDDSTYNDTVKAMSITGLDRDAGYPVNGVHPNSVGQSQIGYEYRGMQEFLYKNNYVPDSSAFFNTDFDGRDFWIITDSDIKDTDGSLKMTGTGAGNSIRIASVPNGTYRVSFYLKGTTGAALTGIFSGSYLTATTNPSMNSSTYQYYEFEGTLNGLTYFFFAGSAGAFSGNSINIKNIFVQKL